MRLVALAAILLTNAAFVGTDRAAVVATGRQPRQARILDPLDALPGWHALRDRDTGVVTQLWGSHIDAPGAMADPAIAERAARGFLAAHLELFAPGARAGDLLLVTNRVDGSLRTVAFHQTWNGMRVVGGQLHVVFRNDRLFVVGSEALPNVQATMPRSGRASPARAEAWLRAETKLAVTARPTGERVVLPIIHGKSDIEYRVADLLDATASAGAWDVYVAPDGAPLLRVSRVSNASGTLRFDVGDRRPTGPRHLAPAPRANLVADGVATTTDDSGGFTWTGSAAAAIDTTVTGPAVQILNAAGAPATASLVAQPAQPVDWSLAADEFGDAQLTAFIYVSVAKARARIMEPALAWLDQSLPVHVNEDGECNALAGANDLHFFKGSATCENTGRLADVVMHEFAHAFHHQTIIVGTGAFNQAMSEGAADFYAANITGDPGIGRGLNFNDTPVRDIDPPGIERVFPADLNGDPHISGLIFAGAMWDLRKALIAKLGTAPGIALAEQLYVGILLRATDIPTTYVAALTADDNDGDLGNGTPHSCEIEAAFGRHGLAGAGFETTSLAAPIVTDRSVSVTVVTPAGGCPKPSVTAMSLAWHVGTDAPQTIAMTAQGDTWTGTIPPQLENTVVRYRITATFDDTNFAVLPDNRADPEYQLFVGDATTIWCDMLDADPQWTQTTNEWQWGTSLGLGGDPPAGFTGPSALGTDLRTNGLYNFNDSNSIATPAIDISGYEHVHLQLRRWLTVQDATSDQASISVNGTPIWQNAISATNDLDHVDKEWRFVDLDLAAFTGGSVAISWSLASNASKELGGWNLDDVCLVAFAKTPRCGDGIVDDGEECDQGIATSICTADCVSTKPPGIGCCSSTTDPRGALVLGLGALVLLGRRRKS
jgi:hypothetical protein